MGKNKRDATTPRRRVSLSKKRTFDRTIVKVISRPNSAAATTQPRSNANIRVVVRVRPPNSREEGDNHRCVIKVVDDQMLVFDPKIEEQGFFFHGVQQKGRDLLKKAHKDMKFVFDKVFSQESATEDVFKNTTFSLIDSLMEGFNCSVFAYGATGAGKTFTMTGNSSTPGVTFLTMTELFRKKDELSEERDFEIGITYLEVYNELVKDLLNPGPPLNLREDAKYGVTVAGIKLYEIKSPNELFSLLEQGNKNRTQHPTDANSESSRSHAVFQVYLKMTIKSTKQIRTAKLSMIDLAGSERGSATGFVGARFTEGANINKSLLALGNCINSLADGLRHVPYRDSKLTRLLKDSLGGNCQTVMIANVSPSSLTYEDTYNTLKYATRAKKIKSAMKQNVVNVDLHVGHYVKLVEELRAEVARLKAQAEVAPPPQDENVEEMREEVARLKEEVAKFEEEVASLKGQLEDNQKTDELETLQKECDRLRGILEDVDSAEEGLTEVMALISEKKEIIERQLKLETIESATAMRRILKEEIDTRLNDICPLSTNTKMNRFGSVIERLKKEEAALKANIDEVSDQAAKVDRRLKDIVTEQPRLKKHVEEQQLKLKCLKFKHYIQLEQKTSQLLLDERRADMALIEKMSSALKSFYTLLQGNELLTPAITKQYQDIGATLQERKDSDKCEKNVGENSRSMCNKRKIEEGSTDNEVLDKTFSMPVAKAAPVSEPAVVKPARTVKAIAPPPMTSKVLKVPPVKRLNNQRPMGFRRPFESNTLAAARSLVTVKSTSSFRGTTKTPTKTDRPRFRS